MRLQICFLLHIKHSQARRLSWFSAEAGILSSSSWQRNTFLLLLEKLTGFFDMWASTASGFVNEQKENCVWCACRSRWRLLSSPRRNSVWSELSVSVVASTSSAALSFFNMISQCVYSLSTCFLATSLTRRETQRQQHLMFPYSLLFFLLFCCSER